MSLKSVIIIVATVLCVYLLWSGSLQHGFEKAERSKQASIINFDKIKGLPVIGAIFSEEKRKSINTGMKDFLQNHELARQCREQPILFGMLGMLIGASVLGIVMIVHLIRSDARFG